RCSPAVRDRIPFPGASMIDWQGVMAAITTAFRDDGAIDHDAVRRHVRGLVGRGCSGIVPSGSLGEGATLDPDEKVELMRSCVAAAGEVPVVPGIGTASTRAAVRLAEQAAALGCRGLMVLPPYVHKGPEAEVTAHFDALLGATGLPCML